MATSTINHQRTRHRVHLRHAAQLLVALCGATALALGAITMHQGRDKAPTAMVVSPIPAAWVLTDEGLAVELPAGLAAHGHPFSLPPTITLESGTAIRVHNNDAITHVVLGMAVPAGKSTTWNAGAPGIEIYSDGCAAHSVGSGMTSLIITERRSTTP